LKAFLTVGPSPERDSFKWIPVEALVTL